MSDALNAQALLDLINAELTRRLDPSCGSTVEEHSAGTEHYRNTPTMDLMNMRQMLIQELEAENDTGGYSLFAPIDNRMT